MELDAVDVVDDRNTISHSTQKFGVNLRRGGSAICKDTDHRGRWIRDRQSDTYTKTMILFANAKVAKILAVGGSVVYFFCKNSGTRGFRTYHKAH